MHKPCCMNRLFSLPVLALALMLIGAAPAPPPAVDAASDCNVRHLLLSNDGIKACLLAAREPGYDFHANISTVGTCDPISDKRHRVITVWKSLHGCTPPCLGPPDQLVLTVHLCGCHIASYTCH